MFSKLLNKEFKLSIHPTNIIFLSLVLMMMIPNYPYYVNFFYMTLGIFFMCLTGRENKDIYYMLMLPVRKSDIVKARVSTIVIFELVQFVLAVPVTILRNVVIKEGNAAGMDANIAFFGIALVMTGLFNLVFLSIYYGDTNKVGKAFIFGSTAEFMFMGIAEVLTHTVPFFKDVLDTPDPLNLTPKLIVLALGIVIYAALTVIAYGKSVKSFNRLDF